MLYYNVSVLNNCMNRHKKTWNCLLPVPRTEALALPGIVERATPIAHADTYIVIPYTIPHTNMAV